MLSIADIKNNLKTNLFGKNIYYFEKIDSTNNYAKTLASNGAETGTVVISEYQTAGKGRLGRKWISDSENNLLFSIIIRPQIKTDNIGLLTFYACISVCMAIENYLKIQCQCKWPNDILINGKKVCGILLESSIKNNIAEYLVVGIGLNVNQDIFDKDINKKATSLKIEIGKNIEREALFCKIMFYLEKFYRDVSQNNFNHIVDEWKKRSNILGKNITLNQNSNKISGLAIDISLDGGLVVKTKDGEKTFYAGDVSIEK